MLGVIVHLEEPFATKLDAIYFVKCTSPSCSKAPPQHDAATPVFHGWNGVLRLAKLPLFSSKHNDGYYAQTVLFLFHQTRGHFSKKYDLCPHVQLQTVVWLFMVVLEQWLLPC